MMDPLAKPQFLIDAEARIRELEAALHECNSYFQAYDLQGCEAAKMTAKAIGSVSETKGEPLPKLECGMGCGRTFCSVEGRDHHEELCEGPTSKIKGVE